MTRTEESSGAHPLRGHSFLRPTERRTFLKFSGGALALALVGCKDMGGVTGPGDDAISLGAGDIAVLNYALLLEQLEADFYIRVVDSPYANMSAGERQILSDLRDHEIIHRDFLRAALGGAAIPALTFDFSAIDFSSRQAVLETSRTFEDLGVSAYNGAGRLLRDAGLLTLAGKIVSVEARHASVIRELLMPGTASFAGNDVVTVDNALDVARTPAEVLAAAGGFVLEEIDATGLPSS